MADEMMANDGKRLMHNTGGSYMDPVVNDELVARLKAGEVIQLKPIIIPFTVDSHEPVKATMTYNFIGIDPGIGESRTYKSTVNLLTGDLEVKEEV